ncbi:MAG: nucleotidyltransferase domain-containing protein [Vulcanisaeta sp.]|nr:DNA polymerase subunit beta [Vulcanisaeta sp. SCGC AB-777_J10]
MQGGSSSGLDRLLRILGESISKGDELLRGFASRVSSEYPSSTIVLFGSRARGDYMPYSDYDVAVVFRKVPDERELMLRIRGLKPGGLSLDLLVLSVDDLSDPVIREMLKGCVILYDGLDLRDSLLGLGCRLMQG